MTETFSMQSVADLFRKGDFSGALARLDQVPESEKGWEVYQLRATTLGILSRFEEAHSDLEKARTLQPGHVGLMTDLADIQIKLGRHDAAKKLLAEALQTDGTWGPAHFKMGLACFETGDFQSALRHCDAAAKHWKDVSYPLTLKARVLMSLGQPAEATFLAALQINPHDIEAMSCLSEHYVSIGEGQKAVVQLEKIVAQSPNHSAAVRQLGLAYFQLSQYAEALPLFKKAMALDPQNRDYAFRHATCLMELGDHAAAIRAFDDLEKTMPNDIVLLCTKAMAQMRAKNHSEAMAILKRAASVDAKHYLPYHYLGLLFTDMGKYADGVKALAKAIQCAPQNAALHSAQGTCFLALSQFPEAIQSYTTAAGLSDLVIYKALLGEAQKLAGANRS